MRERGRILCRIITSWSWFFQKKQISFIGIPTDTIRWRCYQKETRKMNQLVYPVSSLNMEILPMRIFSFQQASPFQRKGQKRNELWDCAFLLLVRMHILDQEIFLDELVFWLELDMFHKKECAVCVCVRVHSCIFYSIPHSWYSTSQDILTDLQ